MGEGRQSCGSSGKEFPGRRAGENRLIIVRRESFNGATAGVEVAARVGKYDPQKKYQRELKKKLQFY